MAIVRRSPAVSRGTIVLAVVAITETLPGGAAFGVVVGSHRPRGAQTLPPSLGLAAIPGNYLGGLEEKDDDNKNSNKNSNNKPNSNPFEDLTSGLINPLEDLTSGFVNPLEDLTSGLMDGFQSGVQKQPQTPPPSVPSNHYLGGLQEKGENNNEPSNNNPLGDLTSGLINPLEDLTSGLVNPLEDLTSGLIDGFQNKQPQIPPSSQANLPRNDYLGGLGEKDNDKSNKPNTNTNNPLEDLTSGLIDPLEDLTSGLIDGFQSGVNQLTDGLSGAWEKTPLPEKIRNFTGKPGYEFGDITRELVRRFREGDYTTEDVWLFLRIAALIGLNLKPIAAALPLKTVLELAEVSVAESMGEKIVGALAGEANLRMKEWLAGESAHRFGEVVATKALPALTKAGVDPEHAVATAASAKAALLQHLEGGVSKDATEQALAKVRQSQSLAAVQDVAKKLLSRQEEKGKEAAAKAKADDQSGASPPSPPPEPAPPAPAAGVTPSPDAQADLLLQNLEEWDQQFLAYKLQQQQLQHQEGVPEEDPFAEWDRQLLLATAAADNAPPPSGRQ